MHPNIAEIEVVAMLQWTQCPPLGRVSEKVLQMYLGCIMDVLYDIVCQDAT